MTVRLLALVFAWMLAVPAAAQSQYERWQLTVSLGDVLGSEEACGLSYEHAAIAGFIEANVPADDMEFTQYLGVNTRTTARQIGRMSTSARAAHCAQIRRVARAYGFIVE